MAVLQVVHPLALIPSSVHMNVDALPIGFVVDPIALIDIAINVGELAEAVRPIILPVSFVARPVLPHLLTVAITEPTNPLSGVLGARRISVGRPLLTFGVRVVRHV